MITIIESSGFFGLENLNGYKKVELLKKYNNDDQVTFWITYVSEPLSFSFDKLYVSNGINIQLNAESTAEQSAHIIRAIELGGSDAHIKIAQIQVDELIITVDKDFTLDESIKETNVPKLTFKGSNKITDDSQILNEKVVPLDGPSLEYTGKEDYKILILIYHGKETIKKKKETDPAIIIEQLLISLNENLTINEFIDADVSGIYLYGKQSEMFSLTISTPESIYLPLRTIEHATIHSEGKIDLEEEFLVHVSELVDLSIFSGKGKDGQNLKIIYQIVKQKIAYACLFTNDVEFKAPFLEYPEKGFITNNFDQVTIHNAHLKGLTYLGNTNLLYADSNCQVDAIVYQGTGKLFDINNVEQNPVYFNVTKQDSMYDFQPMKANVTDFNDFSFLSLDDKLSLKNFDSDEGSSYKSLYDIYADSIIIDEKVNVQFNCNLLLKNSFTVPESSSIVDSTESGVIVLISQNSVILNRLASEYSIKYNMIQLSTHYDLINNSKIIIDDHLCSQNDELNTFRFDFGINDRTNLNLNIVSISASRGVNIQFEAKTILISENTINIDKKTLIPNPQFSAVLELQMGELVENGDVYIKKSVINLITVPAGKYSKLYLDGNIKFTTSNNKNDFIISDLLFLKGTFLKSDDVNFDTYNLILNLNEKHESFPKFTVHNTIYTNMISTFSLIEKIESSKIVFTGLNANQEIAIKGKSIVIRKDDNNYELNTMQFSKIILYIPHSQSMTLSDENSNVVNLKVETSNEKPRVLDFNVITDNDYSQEKSIQSLLKFVIDSSISSKKPEFDGQFGYAFDNGLVGKVIYKEGSDGNEVEQSPEYFPIKMVEVEPFAVKDEIKDETEMESLSSSANIDESDSSDSSVNYIETDVFVSSENDDNNENDNNKKGGLSLGAKIGIGLGAAAAVVGLGTGIGIPVKRHLEGKSDSSSEDSI